jgi:hypothetical protein
MCGPTHEQKDLAAAQTDFYHEMTNEATAAFGKQTAITGALTSTFLPILQAGPNQQGFNPAETTALNTNAAEGVGAQFRNAAAATGREMAAQGGGNEFLPSGEKTEIQAENRDRAAATLSSEQNQILQSNYQTGRANFTQAANELGGTASIINPTGVANSATGAGQAAGTTLNQIQQANASPWTAAISALGGVAGAAAGNINFSSAGGFSYGGGS